MGINCIHSAQEMAKWVVNDMCFFFCLYKGTLYSIVLLGGGALTLLLNKVSNYASIPLSYCCKCRLEKAMAPCTGPRLLYYQRPKELSKSNHLPRSCIRASSKCPLCDISKLDQITLAEHFTDEHTNSNSPWTTLIGSLTIMDASCYSHTLFFF